MRTSVTVLAGSLLLAVWAPAQAESLYEKRLAVIKGTAPGITLIGPDGKKASEAPKAASVAASVPSASASAASPVAQAVPPESGEPGKSWLQRLAEPPSGKSLSEAKKLDAPDQGIRLPTGRAAASQPADGGQPKR